MLGILLCVPLCVVNQAQHIETTNIITMSKRQKFACHCGKNIASSWQPRVCWPTFGNRYLINLRLININYLIINTEFNNDNYNSSRGVLYSFSSAALEFLATDNNGNMESNAAHLDECRASFELSKKVVWVLINRMPYPAHNLPIFQIVVDAVESTFLISAFPCSKTTGASWIQRPWGSIK